MVVDFGATWFGRKTKNGTNTSANSCGFTFAVINNYIINRFWTFEKEAWMPEFGRFVLFRYSRLALNNLLLYVFHEKLKLNFTLPRLLQ